MAEKQCNLLKNGGGMDNIPVEVTTVTWQNSASGSVWRTKHYVTVVIRYDFASNQATLATGLPKPATQFYQGVNGNGSIGVFNFNTDGTIVYGHQSGSNGAKMATVTYPLAKGE